MSPSEIKDALHSYRDATRSFNMDAVQTALSNLVAPDALLRICHPFGTLTGPDEYFTDCLEPLKKAIPDLERRDMIVLADSTPICRTTDSRTTEHTIAEDRSAEYGSAVEQTVQTRHWVGTMGNYMGTFIAPFLGIPPTGHLVHMRYHEFFRIEDARVVEMQCIWDIPELMMQANAWPMAPQLGAFLCTPAPMSGDGLSVSGDGQQTMDHVLAMLTDLCRYPADPDPAVMQLEKYWHPQFNWYGPAGIGTSRGIAGFRNWHQIPFLRGMPDRKLDAMADLESHWIAEGNYTCETGWPNMRLTLSDDGWMGIAPAGKEVLLRSLDFWRTENGLIRENWVLVDLLDLYRQVGVDVLARVQEFNKARNINAIDIPDSMST